MPRPPRRAGVAGGRVAQSSLEHQSGEDVINLRSIYRLPEYHIALPDGEVTINLGQTSVSLIPVPERPSVAATAQSSFGGSGVIEMLRALRSGFLPDGTDMSHPDWSGIGPPPEAAPDNLRSISTMGYPYPALPEALRSFGVLRRRQHREAVLRALGVIRWRRFRQGGYRPVIGLGRHEWSDDGASWYPISLGLAPWVETRSVDAVSAGDAARLQELLDSGAMEPQAHDLFREAWEQRRDFPRSALVLAAASLEVGVKRQVAHFVPAAQWLADNVPSPPVLRILTEYLPSLGADRWIDIPEPVRETIRNLGDARNRLAHRGAGAPRPDALEKMLVAVRNVLYALDYQRGHDWAQAFVIWDGATPTTGLPLFNVQSPTLE